MKDHDETTGPHGRHFKYCYAYEGSYCSCGGDYRGEKAGPRMEMPAEPFSLLTSDGSL
ncbi:hypothetical protein [Streptomyces sp. NEAU-H3]|uniref:hypothetical protein n=1 Tax=Streptomyces sp. NEAU-H3 TaxID=2720636 RepID=UPI00143BC13A|nr:hypothetical protein [Streptomyces sp. NEAU-H3]NJA56727.1 hypothetical protein [Streptomyces sp. NEAU-H3]